MIKYTMLALFLTGSSLCCRQALADTAGNPSDEYVVLLHGLGRTSFSMKRLELFLRKEGYQVVNLTYPSTRWTVERLSEDYLAKLLEQRVPTNAARIHFVCHSLGGIVLRNYLATHQVANLGRVVMFAPPNHGSEIVDGLNRRGLLRVLLGPALLELGTGPDSLPNRLGPARFDCGIIAGNRVVNPILARRLTGPGDGKVTVESTRLDGMKDLLVVRGSHTWLMWQPENLRQTLCFLQSGGFNHEATPSRN